MLDWLIPPAIDLTSSMLLVATSFATAVITASLGIGGGVLLLAVSATLLPPAAIIPVHGLVQAGANGNRALLTRRHIHTPTLLQFAIGAAIGAALASVIVVQLPLAVIQLSIGLFVIYLTWGPSLPGHYLTGWRLNLAACVTTLISMFVGASGPLVAAFVKQISSERYPRVATFSACMTIQHTFKLLVFGLLGFSFGDWLALIGAMILSGYAGTWVGLHLLSKISNRLFDLAFKCILSILAAKLLADALTRLWGS